MKHVVIHQDRRHGDFFFHECHCVWTLRREPHDATIVTRIITGSDPEVHYGTDDPVIRRRVDRLKRRIDRGEHFVSGPLFSGTPRIGSKADRLRGEDFMIVGELHFALAAEPRFVVDSDPGSPRAERQFTSVPGTQPRWADYVVAHQDKNPQERRKRLENLLEELLTFCQPFSPGLQPRRREQFLPILMQRRRTKGSGERAYYASAQSLAMALGAETLEVSVRNIKRRLHLTDRPGDFSYG